MAPDHKGVRESASLLLKVAEEIIASAGVMVRYHDDGVVGMAWPGVRRVEGPRPVSRRRLGFLSFLIGYVVEAANAPSDPVLRARAWRWALRELERHDVRPTRRTVKQAKWAVGIELHRLIRNETGEANPIEPETLAELKAVALWVGPRNLTQHVKKWLVNNAAL